MVRGKRVVLRPVRPSDYPDILRWQNDPEIFYWMDYEREFSFEDIKQSEERAVGEGHPFLVEVDGKGVGRTGLNNFRPRDGLASLYIFIGEPGRSIGADALMTLLRFGFEFLELRKIELWMLDGNERARRLYERAGFVEEARLPERSRKGDVYVDHIVMIVDRGGYERARATMER